MYSITLQTNDTVVSSGDILGRLQFAASAEADGGASQLIGAGIYGMGEGSFGSSSNPASLVFITSADDSNAAVPRIKISEDGDIIPIQGSHNIGEPGNSFNTIYATGLDTRYIALASNVPADTTNKLYNDNGTLKFNGSSIGGAGGGGLNDLIDDTSPQLGANLDINTYSVTGVGNININGDITAEAFYGDLDGVVVTECRNDTGSTIAEGTPVYVAGYYSSNGKPLVAPADCANATKMPAIGLLASELTTGSEGHVHVFGLAQNLPSGVTNGFSVGNTVYVDNGGGLTNVRPTGVSELVQNIGRVLKTGTNGRILVLGPGRSNDVPNSGHFEQLTVDGYTALAVDTGNVGIGTPSPALAGNDKGLHIHATNYPEIKLTNDTTGSTSDDGSVIQVVNSEFRFTNREDGKNISFYAFDTGGTSRQKLLLSESLILVNGAGVNTDFQVKGENDDNVLYVDANNDNVGIGTNTPLNTAKFQIYNAGSTAKNYSQLISGNNKGVGLLLSQTVIETLDSVNGFYSYTYPSTNGNVTNINHFAADPPSGPGTVSNQAGFYAGAGLQYGTNNYGFYGYVPSGTNNYNIYMGGSAKNYFNGNVGIGTPSPSYKLDVAGSGHCDDNISVGLDPLTNNFGLEIYKDKPHIIQRLSDPAGTIINGNWYGNDEVRFATIAHYGPEYSAGTAFNIGPSGSVFASYVADIGIGTLSQDSLIFGTHNTERARINPAGWFAIGTDNPSAKLNVENGNVVFNDLGGTYNFRVEGDADQYLLFVRGDAGADKVGVGTPSLYGKLNTAQTTTNNAGQPRTLDVRSNDYTTTNGQYYTFGEVSTCKKYVDTGVTDTGYIIGKDILCYLSDEGTLNSSVGIRTYAGLNNESDNGTINYAYGIQPRVINNSSVSGSINTAYGVHVYIDGDLRGLGNGGITNAYGVYISDIKYATNSYGVYQDGGLHKNYFAGHVGIGVTNPSSKLNVELGDVAFNSLNGSYTFKVGSTASDNLLYVDGTSNDSVGIGTASPSYKLEVNGDIGLTTSGFYASPTGVMVGTSGRLYNDGQTTLSHGNFSNNGDAQNSSYVLRTSTTNDTFTTIQNNASNVILASNRTMMFTANIVARRTNGQDNAAYKIEGVLVNDGYGASILGTPVKTILYESDSSWDVQAILSGGGAGTSDYLLIQGKGAASKNINWVCKLDLLEVGGDISGYTEANTLNIDAELIP